MPTFVCTFSGYSAIFSYIIGVIITQHFFIRFTRLTTLLSIIINSWLHSKCSVQSYDFAIHHWVFNECLYEVGIFVRVSQTLREGDGES